MMADQDRALWEAVVKADQQLARVRAEFFQHATSRRDVLADALQSSHWERGAALSLLEVLPDDVPHLLQTLVDHALSHRWALAARRAIASGRRGDVTPKLQEIVEARLTTADAGDYRRLAELLAHLGEDGMLGDLLRKANRHSDPEVREVADDFSIQVDERLDQP